MIKKVYEITNFILARVQQFREYNISCVRLICIKLILDAIKLRLVCINKSLVWVSVSAKSYIQVSMRKDTARQINSRPRECLALCSIDGHVVSNQNWKLNSPERDRKRCILRYVRYSWNEQCGIWSPRQLLGDDEIGVHLFNDVTCAVAMLSFHIKVSYQYDNSVHLQRQSMWWQSGHIHSVQII